jgi:triosephosphate isomerase
VNRKVRAAHEASLRPIVCIGETLDQREAGDVEKVLGSQLEAASRAQREELTRRLSPTSRLGDRHRQNASASKAQEAHAFIRRTLTEISDETTANKMRIQYGGSVKPDNARTLMSQPDIDGALVGGASLDPRSFAQIVKGAQSED